MIIKKKTEIHGTTHLGVPGYFLTLKRALTLKITNVVTKNSTVYCICRILSLKLKTK